MRSGWFSIFPHGCNEAVAPPGDGFDVRASVHCVAQRLSQIKDMPGEITFLNEHTGPHFFQQFFFLDDVPCVLDQDEKGFQILGRQDDGLAITQ